MGLQLHFKSELPSIVFTSTIIPPIDIVIRRGYSEEAELTGPLSSIMVELVVLYGDWEKEDWTEEDFKDNIVEAREGKGPLLIGKTVIALKDGIGTFANIKVTDNSRWTKCGFSFGVRVLQQGSGAQEKIREARSKAFDVRDIRGKTSKKHDSPLPTDEIWRLKNIRKGGVYFKNLTDIKIKTVQDFLRLYNTDPDSLQSIITRKKALEETLIHAQKCTIDEKYYIYSSSEEEFMLLLNSIYEVVGVKFSRCQNFQKLDDLSKSKKNKVQILKQKAYTNMGKIEEYNEEPLFDPSQPQEVASTPGTNTINLLPGVITHLNEPGYSHLTNVPTQSHPMIIPPQQQGGCFSPMYSNSSNVPSVSQQEVYNIVPYEDHINYWPANGSTATNANADSFYLEFLNLEGLPDFGLQEGHASHESVPSIGFQVYGNFTGRALNWPVLRALLTLRMQMMRKRMKKIMASKKTDKIE